jgi:hypothetical protein
MALTLSIYFIPMWAGITFLLSLPDMVEGRAATNGGGGAASGQRPVERSHARTHDKIANT